MNRPIYLDYAATTPVCLPALEALYKGLGIRAEFGNPHSSTHSYGEQAAKVVDISTAVFASHVGANPEEIIWTSGATEANNLAIQGAAFFYQSRGKHLITLKTEHKSVLEVFQALEKQGFEVTYLPVQRNGLVNLDMLKGELRHDTLLVSCMAVNNELGTIQPLAEIAQLVKQNNSLFHVDCAQALGKIPLDMNALNIDLASFSGHKVYAPKGIGALYMRRHPRVHLKPLFYGGDQQRKIRPGTLSPALISAFSKGLQFAEADRLEHPQKYHEFRTIFLEQLSMAAVKFTLNTDLKYALSHILNLRFVNAHSERLENLMSKIAIARGSACNSSTMHPSHVLRAIGLKSREADQSVRISFGVFTTKEEVISAAKLIAEIL